VGDVGTFEADDAALTVTGGDEPGAPGLARAEPGEKSVYEIGKRRELFMDDFLIDNMSGGVERRLHHPTAREVVLELNQPWEGQTSAYFATVRDGERVLMYYRGQVGPGSEGQVCCLAESQDGIHFKRINAGLFEYDGSKDNNIVWKGVGAHNFTPFLDSNPDASADERFKAVGYSHHGKGLGVFASADGIRWRELLDHPAITNGAFDSQNLAFWDAHRQCYVDFHRKGRNGVRDIMTCTNNDFRTWTEHYRHPGMRLRRGVIRKDGFVSLQSAGKVGEALTRPLRFAGDSLEVNYATDAVGWIRFELCQSDGTPIKGFTLYDSETLYGNELRHTVKWRGGSLSGLHKESIRIRIRMENADLYSLRFVE
jgi:hypothetical protein